MCLRTWERILVVVPDVVDFLINKMINLVVWLTRIQMNPLNKSIRKHLSRCLLKNRHCDYFLWFLILPMVHIFVTWKMTTWFVCLASKGSLLTITSFGCQQYTGNSAHLATLYCLPRATRDNLESQGRAVLPMCLLKHKRAGEEHTLRWARGRLPYKYVVRNIRRNKGPVGGWSAASLLCVGP